MGRGDPGTRREFLAASGSTIVGLAGCIGTDEADPATTTNPTTSSSTTTRSPSTDPGFDLDLREANVLDVAFESSGDGSVQFDVTLLHDDDGEDGYADWWQVETPEGSQLGRRTLLHAHGTQPFTRSATVEIPAEVTCVVLRGHDQTHGWGPGPVGGPGYWRHPFDSSGFGTGDCHRCRLPLNRIRNRGKCLVYQG